MSYDRSSQAPVHVGRLLARYLAGERYDAGAATADVGRDLCSWLGTYIDRILRQADGWSPWWAIDDACPYSIERAADGEVSVRGNAHVLGDTLISVDQPFHVTVRLDPRSGAAIHGRVRFGDAAVGLRHDGPRRQWPSVDAWVLEVVDSG